MAFSFRPAITTEAKPLIGLYAESGRGKTFSALLLARGFAGDMAKVGMIETESGRGEVFADHPVVGGYKVLSLRTDFSPKAYGEAISAAEKAGLQALILDSASHEWEGVGGVLSMAATNQANGKKGVLVWQQPKIDHQREFLLRLMQSPIPLVVVCMRAKYPMVQVTPDFAKSHPGAKVGEWARDTDLSPKQSEDILFEMMVHGWIDEAHALHLTKTTTDAFKTIFVDGKPITVETGQRLAAWAAGNKAAARTAGPVERTDAGKQVVAPPPNDDLRARRLAVFKRVTGFAPNDAGGALKALTALHGHACAKLSDMTEEDCALVEALSDEQLQADILDAANDPGEPPSDAREEN